jgi:hypothetical protein
MKLPGRSPKAAADNLIGSGELLAKRLGTGGVIPGAPGMSVENGTVRCRCKCFWDIAAEFCFHYSRPLIRISQYF